APRPDKEDPLLTAMGHEAATVDALVARTGWPADRLLARLLELELDGLVVRLPGGLLQRRATT
ncbi:DprA-like winged helix domain-containing protein, partial [Ideonella azotifigens]